MEWGSVLAERKRTILKKWFDDVVDTYPADTSKFLKRQKDPFDNPVGSTTRKSLSDLLDELCKPQIDSHAIQNALDPVIRIRAVQTVFSPAQAVGFAFSLKQILKNEFENELKSQEGIPAFWNLLQKIDEMAMIAFNIYMQCRETVLQLKINAEKERIYSAFSRAGLVKEIPEDSPES